MSKDAETFGEVLSSGRRREWLAYAINGFELLYLSSTSAQMNTAEEQELALAAANALRKLYYKTGDRSTKRG